MRHSLLWRYEIYEQLLSDGWLQTNCINLLRARWFSLLSRGKIVKCYKNSHAFICTIEKLTTRISSDDGRSNRFRLINMPIRQKEKPQVVKQKKTFGKSLSKKMSNGEKSLLSSYLNFMIYPHYNRERCCCHIYALHLLLLFAQKLNLYNSSRVLAAEFINKWILLINLILCSLRVFYLTVGLRLRSTIKVEKPVSLVYGLKKASNSVLHAQYIFCR